MRCIKMLGLAAIAAAALMAFAGAGSASATELTCNGVKCAAGSVIHAATPAGTHTTFHPPIGTIRCNSTFEGSVTDAGGPAVTSKYVFSLFIITPCTDGWFVKVIKLGTLEIHSTGGGSATVTWIGAEITVQGAGFHCIFSTGNGVDIGTLTTNTASGGSATLDIAAAIPRTGGTSGVFCGSTAQWTGSYKTTKPTSLIAH